LKQIPYLFFSSPAEGRVVHCFASTARCQCSATVSVDSLKRWNSYFPPIFYWLNYSKHTIVFTHTGLFSSL